MWGEGEQDYVPPSVSALQGPGEGRTWRPLSNLHSRVQGPRSQEPLLPLSGQHRSSSQNWGAQPGAWSLPSSSKTL